MKDNIVKRKEAAMHFIKKKEIVAMLLAGGQGSRLGVLTTNIAKPAVPFGGKYRIIDFPLSNCINSDIDTVGVLTQYRPMELNAYIGNGQPWDLDRIYGGTRILPPYMTGKAGEWYRGTANAIYQNISYIEQYDPEYVAVLSGDHVYKMNYRWMLDFHKEKGADCTIAVMEVPIEEASRFGVMNTDGEARITEFEEKPPAPKSNLVSMGVYIFTWEKLYKYLVEDELDPNSSNDFGKDLIPAMLAAGERMYAYKYLGYWKDVGTVFSLWDANMDLLREDSGLRIYDERWKIYARNTNVPPQYIGKGGSIANSLVSEGSSIYGRIENSIIAPSVDVGPGAVITNSVIMPGVQIAEDVRIDHAIIGSFAKIGSGVSIGGPSDLPEPEIAVVAEGVRIGPGCKAGVGEVVPSDRMEV